MATNLEALIAQLDGLDAAALTHLIFAAEECHAKKFDEARATLEIELQLNVPARLVLRRVRKSKPRPDNRTRQAVLYRGPEGEQWTGRGKPPRWLVELEAQGKSRDHYHVSAGMQEDVKNRSQPGE
jgi:DNA-binding protein H-NS